MESRRFWNEVRRRRNQVLFAWFGWFVVGGPLWGFFSLLMSANDTMSACAAAVMSWGTFWSSMTLRLRSLRCYRCGGRAFDNPYFTMSQARCGSCGVSQRTVLRGR
jgi:hypothetical protein